MKTESVTRKTGIIRNVFFLMVVCTALNIGCNDAQTISYPSEKGKVVWKSINEVPVPIPPKVHPRLYINPEEVKLLESRLKHPVLEHLVGSIKKETLESEQTKIEWDAIHYLISGDAASGGSIISSTIAYLKNVKLGTQGDAARQTGRAMVTGAIVYDWLYELISPAEKEMIINELIRLAKTLECGYPPTRQGNVVGHSSESFVMRDLLSAGIAIYDEFPEMYELAAVRFFGEQVPVRNWIYNGHAYHQGDSYGPLRYAWDTYPLMMFDRMGVSNIYNPEQRYVPYFYIYSTRPDGARLRSGDTYFHSSNKIGEPWHLYEGALFTASYYGDGVILDQFIRQGFTKNTKTWDNLFQFLWWDVDLQVKPVTSLSYSKYFGTPFGWMIARTGWDKNSVVAEMKVNEYNFANHQHLDAGAFQIYYRGSLATESGLYKGTSGAYGSPHNTNYYKRTIAHNSLLVYDPAEEFKDGHCNDGGQRLPNGRSEPANLNAMLTKGYKTGTVLARDFGPDVQIPDFTYLKGDLTEAYSGKVSQVNRSFVFLNLHNDKVPAAMIVFDKLVSASPSFKKFWLLHSIDEPCINGNEVTIKRVNDTDNGKLVNTILLPEVNNFEITPVGGPGKEFWVFGTNYANEDNSPSYERAAWRIEISPKTETKEDYFLNTMQVMESEVQGLNVKKIEGEKVVGSCISDRMVFFSKNSELMRSSLSFTITDEGKYKILITDLMPGKWKVLKNDKIVIPEVTVESEKGIIYFEGSRGNYSIVQLNPEASQS